MKTVPWSHAQAVPTEEGIPFFTTRLRGSGMRVDILPDGNPLVAFHCLAAADVLLPTRSSFSVAAYANLAHRRRTSA
jgi:hypothetical protein